VTTPPQRDAGQTVEQAPVCPRHPDRVAYVRCQRCERPVCPECQRPAAVGVQCVDCVRQQSRGVRSARTVFGGNAGAARPLVTEAIIAVCVAVFVLQWVSKDRVTFDLSFYPPEAVNQPYRFLTAAFLHSTSFILHIAFNLYALWMVGPYLERLLGRAQYAVLYLLSAVGGSVGYFLLVSPGSENWATGALGASGAVFGLFGAWFVVNRRLGRDVTGIVALVVINGALGFLPGIAWQAHLGGLVTGLVITALFAYLPRNRPALRWSALAGVAVLLVVVVLVRVQTLPENSLVVASLSTLWTGGVDNTVVIPQL
jgi:membrane associated rhomboid family serine protease